MPSDNPFACRPEEVVARAREALPRVRRLALDAHDHRAPPVVVGHLHSAANELQAALESFDRWQRQEGRTNAAAQS